MLPLSISNAFFSSVALPEEILSADECKSPAGMREPELPALPPTEYLCLCLSRRVFLLCDNTDNDETVCCRLETAGASIFPDGGCFFSFFPLATEHGVALLVVRSVTFYPRIDFRIDW